MPVSSSRNGARSQKSATSAPRSARRSGRESARVYDLLRKQILGGDVLPGTHLSQQSIAGEMGTSNGPVISALRRLAFDGLVVHERSYGYRVCDWSADKLDDLLTVRRALETEAAWLAARRAGPEDIERLERIVERMDGLVREERWQDADEIDVELHVEIARLSRSPGLIESLERCHLLEVVRRRIAMNERIIGFQKLASNHAVLVEAIASGNPDLAARAMHTHLAGKHVASSKRTRPGRGAGNG
jgi:DNA-binding GntR family transcriptional regulator